MLHELRDLDLRKSPSISEAVDWARTLAVLNAETLDPALLSRTISVVLKYEKDVGTALSKVRALQDPNRRAGRGGAGRDKPRATHDHGAGAHEHGAGDQDHEHEPAAAAAAPSGSPGLRPASERTEEGAAARADKDLPGRHGNYYGGRSAFNKR